MKLFSVKQNISHALFNNIFPFKKHYFLFALLLVSIIGISNTQYAFAEPTAATSWRATPFPVTMKDQLFSIQGSNTVGENLVKNLAINYLQAKGAEKVQAIAQPIANEYRVQGFVGDNKIFIDIAAHGSSTGFEGLLAGTCDIAMSSRRIKAQEVDDLAFLGKLTDLHSEHVIAIDGLAVIVNPQNSLTTLDLKQIAQVFAGKTTDWEQLGGTPGKINLYARDDKSGTWDTFKSLVLDERNRLSATARRFESNDELSDLVANDPNGIGFVGLASVRQSAALAISEPGTLPLAPNKLVVATEDYVLSRRLFLYTPAININPNLDDFIAYVHSAKGQDIVEQTGFVSLNILSIDNPAPLEGPEEYVNLLNSAKRLSINFRFAEGSARLDNKALRDIARVAAFMREPENRDKQLILVGFADQKQTDTRAKVLSKLRAVEVKSALLKEGVSSGPIWGFGANLPVAGNHEGGRIKNRRVEIWIKDNSTD